MRGDPARQVRAVGLLALGVGVGVAFASDRGSVPLAAIPLLAAAVAVCEFGVVYLQFGRQRWTLSLTEAVLAAAMVLAVGAWLVAAVVLGVAAVQLTRRQPRLKRGYNIAQFTAATALGQAVAAALQAPAMERRLLAAAAGMAVFWAVNYLLVAGAVAVTARRSVLSLIRSSAPLSLLHTAGNTSVGLLAAYLAVRAPAGLLGLLVPFALLWSSYEQQARRAAEARLFAELARGQELQNGRSRDVSAQVVVTAAARLLGGADVELVLVAPDGPVVYRGDEAGVPVRERVSAEVFDTDWVVAALGHGGVSAGRDAHQPFLHAVLGQPERPLAVLRARRARTSPAFDRTELRLAKVLVGQAESWLSVAALTARSQAADERAHAAGQAARALSDLGSATAPSLLVLRESADRLARLAERSGGVDDIVEELHLVERAVASLLGAIALAADPDLLETGRAHGPATEGAPEAAGAGDRPAGAVPLSLPRAVRAAGEWTTTGVLR